MGRAICEGLLWFKEAGPQESPEFSGLENTEAPLVLEQRCLQVRGAVLDHPFSALWPHTMAGHFLSGAARMLKRLRQKHSTGYGDL